MSGSLGLLVAQPKDPVTNAHHCKEEFRVEKLGIWIPRMVAFLLVSQKKGKTTAKKEGSLKTNTRFELSSRA